MTTNKVLSMAFFTIGLIIATGTAVAESKSVVREFATRPSMSVKAIVVTPDKPIGQVILLPGGGGDIGLNSSGQITARQMADNFVVRTRNIYADAGYTTVVLDTASDVLNLMNSREAYIKHRDDVLAVAGTLKKESSLPLWIVGTSASSLRLALMAPRLQSDVGIAGVALTSTVIAVPEILLKAAEKITVPVLVLHHREDACAYCKPEALQTLIDALKTSSKKVVWIEGGSSQGDPCHEWAYHGFNGKEPEAVGSIISWMKAPQ
jgi:hypothetical protein